MVEIKLEGSGGWINADLTDEQVTKSKLVPNIEPNEAVADGLILIERGQYTCHKCNTIIGEYRVFQKKDE
jgi:hypothetical protein